MMISRYRRWSGAFCQWSLVSIVVTLLTFVFIATTRASDTEKQTTIEPPPEEETIIISDPLEPINRFFFQFNDKMYFWVVKPVGTVYKTFIPTGVRTGIKNAFNNLRAPIRLVSCLVQGRFSAASTEVERFVINSTLGVGGYFDIAKTHFDIEPHNEDFGQALGARGVDEGIYINWPILGPSTARDSVGLAVDFFLDPLLYMPTDIPTQVSIRAGSYTNDTSLRIGEYEDLKKASVDPYIAVKDAYIQHRRELIKR